jgi:hypothetical protein
MKGCHNGRQEGNNPGDIQRPGDVAMLKNLLPRSNQRRPTQRYPSSDPSQISPSS